MMNWIVENWVLLVIAFCAVVAVVQYVKSFTDLDVDEQLDKVREWLLYAVTMAEKDLGSGTGKLKLRYVYDMFLQKFGWLAEVVSFEEFSSYVDDVLKEMNHLLYTNKDIANYVNDEQAEEGFYYIMEVPAEETDEEEEILEAVEEAEDAISDGVAGDSHNTADTIDK